MLKKKVVGTESTLAKSGGDMSHLQIKPMCISQSMKRLCENFQLLYLHLINTGSYQLMLYQLPLDNIGTHF